MDLLQLLDTIDTTGMHINEAGGQLKLTGPAGDRAPVRAAVAHHRDLLLAHLRGINTGHLLAFCDHCGEATLTAAKAAHGKARAIWPTCRMTPACPGHHHPRPTDLARWRDAPSPPPQPQPPPRARRSQLLGPLSPYPPSNNYTPQMPGATS